VVDKKLIVASLFLLAFHLIFTPVAEYDHFRNLKIAQEMSATGRLLYFGSNFLSNPPLAYLPHALLIRLFGFHYTLHRLLDLAFWIGAMWLAEALGRELKLDNLGLMVGLSWVFVFATAIRSYSDMMFWGALSLLLYFRLKHQPSWRHSLYLGLALGAGLATKYSFGLILPFLVLDWMVVRKPLRFLIPALLVPAFFMTPLVIHAGLNDLPQPWQLSRTTNLSWREEGEKVLPTYLPYLMILEFWPLLTLLALFSLKADLFTYLLAGLPVLGGIATGYFEVRHFIFILLPLAVAAARTVKQKKWWKGLAVGYVIIFLILGLSRIQPVHDETDFLSFATSIRPNETVLGGPYHLISLFASGDSEQMETLKNPSNAIILGATYYLTPEPLNHSLLSPAGTFELKGTVYAGTYYLYHLNLTRAVEEAGLMTAGIIRVRDTRGRPVYRAECTINGNGWSLPQVSDKAGEILLLVPPGGYVHEITCSATGFHNATISQLEDIVMTPGGLFFSPGKVRF